MHTVIALVLTLAAPGHEPSRAQMKMDSAEQCAAEVRRVLDIASKSPVFANGGGVSADCQMRIGKEGE